jgi:UMF1 family MFS transporter
VALGFIRPHQIWPAMAWYVLAIIGYEMATVFYNAFLVGLSDEHSFGKVSAWGWAIGYVGGLLALLVSLPFLPKSYEASDAAQASVVYWIAAGWYLIFSLPTLFWLKPALTRTREEDGATAESLNLWQVLAVPGLSAFLLMYFLYMEGTTTVIEFTGAFTKEVLGFSPRENVMLFLVLNVIAAPGALLFGYWLDAIGPKRSVRRALIAWCVVCVGVSLSTTRVIFWLTALLAAAALGAIQSASRAWMARLAPPGQTGQYMGLLALSGKASAIVGPTLFGLLADIFASLTSKSVGYRLTMVVFGLLFVAAMLLLQKVPEKRSLQV